VLALLPLCDHGCETGSKSLRALALPDLERGLCAAPHTKEPNKQHSDSDQRQYGGQDEGGQVDVGATGAAFAQQALPIEFQFKRNHVSCDPKGTHDSGHGQRQTEVENDGSQIPNGQCRGFYRADSTAPTDMSTIRPGSRRSGFRRNADRAPDRRLSCPMTRVDLSGRWA
jgi:hypothetical protein